MWPIPIDHLQQFSVFFIFQDSKLSELAFQVKALGVADSTEYFRICKMIEEWNKKRIRMPYDRSLFSPAILMRLGEPWGSICSDRYEASLFQAATFLRFLGAFCISEIVAADKHDTSQMALQPADVTMGKDRL